MFLRSKRSSGKKLIDRRALSERRSGQDRRNLYRFEAVGTERRVGKLRRSSEWPASDLS